MADGHRRVLCGPVEQTWEDRKYLSQRNERLVRRRDSLTRLLAPQLAERVIALGPMVPVRREATVISRR